MDRIGDGANSRPLDDTIAGIGEGTPDDALGIGQELPTPPTDAEVAATARRLGAPVAGSSQASVPNPGDEAAAGVPGTGENVCRTCNGSGRAEGGECPTCGGSGIVIEGIGGG